MIPVVTVWVTLLVLCRVTALVPASIPAMLKPLSSLNVKPPRVLLFASSVVTRLFASFKSKLPAAPASVNKFALTTPVWVVLPTLVMVISLEPELALSEAIEIPPEPEFERIMSPVPEVEIFAPVIAPVPPVTFSVISLLTALRDPEPPKMISPAPDAPPLAASLAVMVMEPVPSATSEALILISSPACNTMLMLGSPVAVDNTKLSVMVMSAVAWKVIVPADTPSKTLPAVPSTRKLEVTAPSSANVSV